MTTSPPIEVRDMRIVHQTFRSAYDEGARLVRANPKPSAARVEFLADHIDFGVAMLHHHHASEDELLYPLLVERAPEQSAMTREVERQHVDVTSAIDAVSSACRRWRAGPSADSGDELAAMLDDLNSTLQPHLDDEERKVVPLAAITLTQAEWAAMGEHARGAIPRDRMPIAFGMMIEPLDASDAAYMKSQLPAPVRLLYPLLIERPWKSYASLLRNGT